MRRCSGSSTRMSTSATWNNLQRTHHQRPRHTATRQFPGRRRGARGRPCNTRSTSTRWATSPSTACIPVRITCCSRFPRPGRFFDDQFPYGLFNGQGKILAPQTAAGVAVDVTVANVAGITAVVPKFARIQGTVTGRQRTPRGRRRPALRSGPRLCRVDDRRQRPVRRPEHAAGVVHIQAGAAHHVWWRMRQDGRSRTGSPGPRDGRGRPAYRGSRSCCRLAGRSMAGSPERGDVPAVGVNVAGSPLSGGIWEFGPGGDVTAADGDVLGRRPRRRRLSPRGIAPAERGPPRRLLVRGGLDTDDDDGDDDPYRRATPRQRSWHLRVVERAGAQRGTSTVPVGIGWTASDPGSGIGQYRVQQQTNGGSWATVTSPLGGGARSFLRAIVDDDPTGPYPGGGLLGQRVRRSRRCDVPRDPDRAVGQRQ